MSPPPPFTVSMGDFSLTPPDPEDQLSNTVDSAMKWSTAATVVVTVVLIIAIIAIACAIVKCLKRAPTMSVIPSQIQISTTDHKASNNNKEIALALPADSDSQEEMEFATMERFLNNINQEKPIRFSPEELKQITNNYTTILGSGAFGVVYKGELPNEEKVAVKVLNGMDLGTEEQFKAEVSTIGRTYHINLVRLYGFCFHSDKRALVYEFVPNGSLYSLLFGSLNTQVEFGKLHEIAIGTATGGT